MRYLALATDYDNTLARDSRVDDATLAALGRLRASGRRAILLTGRQLDDLLAVCNCIDRFDYIVAENGAHLYEPASRTSTLLAKPLPQAFIAALRARGVNPLEVGKVIVATYAPHEFEVIQTIRELGYEFQVIFNRSAVMVLPPGINKATGMRLALRKLGMSPHEVVAVGDAENDHSFLRLAECPVAVANAIDSIKESAVFVTRGEAGAGVAELIDAIVANDFEQAEARLEHHHIPLGTRLDGTSVWVPPYGRNILVAGSSGSGKSTFATGLIERFAEQLYQVCVIDPEGDYLNLETLVTIGDRNYPPALDEIMAVMRDPDVNVNLNLLGVALADRPAFFSTLLPHLHAMRTRTGRPHWIVVDEAHHLLPAGWGHPSQQLGEVVLITVHADRLVPPALASIDVVVAVGTTASTTLQEFAAATGRSLAAAQIPDRSEGDVLCWLLHGGQDPFPMRVIHAQAERLRHHRKYAVGDVKYHSFYFRGPQGRQNLKAQNLAVFCQIAEGIDEETWMFHLRRGDYSRWIRDVIKDEELAQGVLDIERRLDLTSSQTRALVRAAIETRYTLHD